MRDFDLWCLIKDHRFDTGDVAFSFDQRLARENGWTQKMARDAIDEYKKFIYLCAISPHQMTPSDSVDQVWHLHLTYSYNYWELLCKNLLKKPLHHGPTKGGHAQETHFYGCYEKTLELYEQEFQQKPPLNIWPTTQQRFKEAIRFQRVSQDKYLILPKIPVYLGAIGLGVLGLSACSFDFKILGFSGFSFVAIMLVISIITIIFALIAAGRTTSKKSKDGSGCSGGVSSGCSSKKDNDSSGVDSDSSDGGSSGCGSGCGGGGD